MRSSCAVEYTAGAKLCLALSSAIYRSAKDSRILDPTMQRSPSMETRNTETDQQYRKWPDQSAEAASTGSQEELSKQSIT